MYVPSLCLFVEDGQGANESRSGQAPLGTAILLKKYTLILKFILLSSIYFGIYLNERINRLVLFFYLTNNYLYIFFFEKFYEVNINRTINE